MRTIVVIDPIDETGINVLKKYFNGKVIYKKEEINEEIIKEAHALIVRKYILNDKVLEECKNLVVIGKHGVGVDNIDINVATNNNIPITFTPTSNSQSVAEHAISMMMGLAKNTILCHNSTMQGNFEIRDYLQNIELYKKTLGLVGCGNIGRRVGEMCFKAFNMEIITYDPYLESTFDWARRTDNLEELFSVADFISVHIPLSYKTKHLVSDKLLDKMKETAFIVNTSRGGVIDERALIDALKVKKIGGIAMDVFEVEPPMIDNPLLKMNNVLLSPHMGGITTIGLQKMSMDIAENVLSILEGNRNVPLINPEVWKQK
jgi:D-3-phosphoglycerate dehydrogenase